MIDADTILEGLNDAQREAVTATEGPLLIVAGAGSGKTRVITHRLGYILTTGRAVPHEIVAVTFTNKAAGEMKERISALSGLDAAGARIGTFHSLCLRILRREADRAGLSRSFQIYDTSDQLAVLRGVLKDLDFDETSYPPRQTLSRISHLKSRLVTAEAYLAQAGPSAERVLARVYAEYQDRLNQAGGLDFDDLLLVALRLLEDNPDVGPRLARSCRYLLVDEYQDTNHPQYRLIRALSSVHRNVCCVGDQDQSIYRFRGADIRNIREFEQDYPDARMVKLERNYRSTKTILHCAGSVIEKNPHRHATRLWTDKEPGEPVHLHRARDDRDEAEAVVRIIASLTADFPTGEIAVLYRTNNQSRLIEEALVRSGMRYRIVGSLRFYERKEIKDLLAYLRLIVAPDDDISFVRAIGAPARGIGKTTLGEISTLAAARGQSLAGASRAALAEGALSARAATGLTGFLDLLAFLRVRAGVDEAFIGRGPLWSRRTETLDGPKADALPGARFRDDDAGGGMGREAAGPTADAHGGGAQGGTPPADGSRDGARAVSAGPDPGEVEPGGSTFPPVVPVLTELVRVLDIAQHLQKAHPGDHEDRLENVEALVSAAAEYDELQLGGGLQGFLDRTSLRGDTDDVAGDSGVTLLTIHSAKGLEFGAVILTGLEENLFPHIRSAESPEEMEEERRLCYVAMTRAKSRLILTNAVIRRSFGDFVENPPSRFIEEIPAELLVRSESSPWTGVRADPLRAGRADRGGPSAFPGGLWEDDEAGHAAASRGAYGPGRGSRRHGAPLSSGSRGAGRGAGSGASRGVDSGTSRGARESVVSGLGSDDYAVGRTVTHPMFGRGRILHIEGAGEALKLTIHFRESGTRKILPRHTTLVVHD